MATPTVGILATGSYLPKEEVGNEEVAERAGVTAEWILRKTQIAFRRRAAPDEATSDLAARAAADALRRSGVGADRIGYVIVATSTGDSPQPPTSYLVQDALGVHGAACFDVNVVCSGFVYALELARSLIALRPDTCALVVGADVYSRILDPTDRRTAVLFGDGAGAAVVGTVPEPYGIIACDLSSRGEASGLIGVRAGGSRLPASYETVAAGDHYFRMDGRGVRDFVMENVSPVLERLVRRAGHRLDQVDVFVPHQPNGVLLGQLVEQAGLTGARTARTLERYGNVGSASVPVTLDEAGRTGMIGDGDLVLLAGFGGGMAVGAALLRWSAAASGEAR
ncbi:3-oxoacyl-[acyl-carrier-protein] synthase-3 [Streptosporangium becharense]|uniref:3-oxoacyl-[acyl-carrier-protein] synthase-3 n=1 Tax=Streptosporangium becharense TaxID=1816182 RepID=A0A7W9ICE0_9ACTN|nr:ketoacyl-ACP synthase III [Streptosporangium becharense]MBB2913053.1 3-oxoacyl-[acyl-carrier-protein] synthase-3 [Streptosporangium becharense]MBB5818122.1 3-oxoacyl-[acyl-carrier-protein] synthase-3 [Streptosporangium becharense]